MILYMNLIFLFLEHSELNYEMDETRIEHYDAVSHGLDLALR